MLKKSLHTGMSLYQYGMSILAFLSFVALPTIESSKYFESTLIDLFVRCFLWGYFTFAYFSLASAIKRRVTGRQPIGFNVAMYKNFSSFLLLGMSSIALGAFLLLVTQWSLSAYFPQLPDKLIVFLSFSNGSSYGVLVFIQYFLLPDE